MKHQGFAGGGQELPREETETEGKGRSASLSSPISRY